MTNHETFTRSPEATEPSPEDIKEQEKQEALEAFDEMVKGHPELEEFRGGFEEELHKRFEEEKTQK